MKLFRTLTLSAALALGAATQVSAQGFGLDAQLWQAGLTLKTEEAEIDLGDSPVFVGALTYKDAGWDVAGRVAYGQGWSEGDLDVERLEIGGSALKNAGPLSYGLGGRWISTDLGTGDSIDYYGPEIIAALSIPVGGPSLSLNVRGSAGVYLWDASSEDGTTAGYSAEGGLAWAFEQARLSAGYRIQKIEEDGAFGGEELTGPYFELGFIW